MPGLSERARSIPGLGHLLVGQPEVGERLQRGLALKGELPQFTETAYGLSITAEDLTLPEFSFLRRQMRYVGGTQQAAVAAQVGQITFGGLNAGNRGVAVVDRIVLTNLGAAALTYLVGMALTGANIVSPSLNAAPADDRVGIAAAGFNPGIFGIGFGTFAAGALSAVTNTTVQVPPNETRALDGPWIMTNAFIGSAGARAVLVAQAVQVNVAVAVSFYWRERAALATELG